MNMPVSWCSIEFSNLLGSLFLVILRETSRFGSRGGQSDFCGWGG